MGEGAAEHSATLHTCRVVGPHPTSQNQENLCLFPQTQIFGKKVFQKTGTKDKYQRFKGTDSTKYRLVCQRENCPQVEVTSSQPAHLLTSHPLRSRPTAFSGHLLRVRCRGPCARAPSGAAQNREGEPPGRRGWPVCSGKTEKAREAGSWWGAGLGVPRILGVPKWQRDHEQSGWPAGGPSRQLL